MSRGVRVQPMGLTKLYPTLSMLESLLLTSLDLRPNPPPLPPAGRARHHLSLQWDWSVPMATCPLELLAYPFLAKYLWLVPLILGEF